MEGRDNTMIEITREERNKILRKLTKIAKTLAIQATIDRFDVTEKEAKENPIDYRYWLSTDHKTCYYGGNRSLPIDYHIKKKRNVIFLIHFLPEHCENVFARSEEHTSELQSHHDLVCRL